MARTLTSLALSLFVAATMAASSLQADARSELAVIVHPGTRTAPLTATELERIFSARTRNWPGGRRIVPLNLPSGSRGRLLFDRAVLGMGPEQVARFWIDRRVRGGARPPRQAPDPEMVVKVVERLHGAIGYVPPEMITGRVRVVARIDDGEVIPP